MAREPVTWVKMGPPSWPGSGYESEKHLGHCARCGALICKPELPALIDDVVKFLNEVTEFHRDCYTG